MAKAALFAGAKSRRVLLLSLAAVLGLGVLLVLASVVEHFYYSSSVLPGVRIDGMHVGGAKEADARAAIEQLRKQLDTATIRAHAGNKTFVVDPGVIDFTVDTDATLREIQDAGRPSNPWQLVTDTVLRRFRPDVVHLVVHYDDARFEGLFDGWSNALQSGLVEGGLRFRGTTVVPVKPRAGRGLLRTEAEQSLRAVLTSGTRRDLNLPIGNVTPQVGPPSTTPPRAPDRC
jgi:hypothetical protein